MIYLLDTDTLIFMIRGLKTSSRHRRKKSLRESAQKLAERCQQTQKGGHTVGLSAVTVSELEFGAQNSGQYEDEIRAVHKVLTPFDLFDYDAVHCAYHYGRVRHQLEAEGQPTGSMDLLIAAHALSLEATLITNNGDHFSRVDGLPIENWAK